MVKCDYWLDKEAIMIYEKAYAKVNLALAVGKKNDQYHEVENVMIPVNLYDELFFEASLANQVECDIEIENNLCLKAIELFQKKYGVEQGVSLILKKNIPLQAGLAGGSSDAAATLRGLNRLFDKKLSIEELEELAGELGSDVPFFLYNQPALCVGRGEIVRPLDFEVAPFSILIIKPDFGLSTKEIYAQYEYDGVSRDLQIKKLMDALRDSDLSSIDSLIFNDLEGIALKQNDSLMELFNKLASLSYLPHISGSGPSIFLLDAKMADYEIISNLDASLKLFLCHSI